MESFGMTPKFLHNFEPPQVSVTSKSDYISPMAFQINEHSLQQL